MQLTTAISALVTEGQREKPQNLKNKNIRRKTTVLLFQEN